MKTIVMDEQDFRHALKLVRLYAMGSDARPYPLVDAGLDEWGALLAAMEAADMPEPVASRKAPTAAAEPYWRYRLK